MRSALGKELRKQFAQAMSRRFPQYTEIKAPSVWPGARMYVHRTPQASYFIRLVPDHKGDMFRIMFGWSSSGEFPDEALRDLRQAEFDEDLPGHDGLEFRIMVHYEAGGSEDRWWVLDDPMAVAFERAKQEFGKPGDTEIQTLERAVGEGLSYIMSSYHKVPAEKLLPKLPGLIEDCMQCIQDTVIPYFDNIRQFKS